MKQLFDLHIHTNNSDGELSVEELVYEIKKNNIKIFSITDHDTIDALNEIKSIDVEDLKFIKGIEFSSILDKTYKMHILGYNIDENNQDILNITNNLKKLKKARFYELADILFEKYNFKFEKEELDYVIENIKNPSKSHMAKLMVKKGYINSVEEAFLKYLDNINSKTPNRIDVKVVINAIKSAGGIAIWAHPKKFENQYGIDFEELLPRLLDMGLDGIEIYNSLHSLQDCKRYEQAAKKFNLITTGGSDFHGVKVKPNVKLGEVFNSGEDYVINTEDIKILKEIE